MQGFELLSGMLTRSVCLGRKDHALWQRETTNDRRWPIPNLHFYFSESLLKSILLLFLRAGSSVGERMTEAHGVGGSIPSLPIFINPIAIMFK